MINKKNLGILISILLFVGCATEYQQVGITGGFIEKQFARNEFAVNFSGNGYTTGQRAVDLCLLRCAELTLGHGFHYFVLTANNAGYDTSTSITTGNYVPTGYGGGVYFSTTQAIPKPSASNRILCFREKPAYTSDYYDAQNVFEDLSNKYGIHKEIEEFSKFRLPLAAVGVRLEKPSEVIAVNSGHPGGNSLPAPRQKSHFKITSFVDGNLAQKAGLQIGDEILSYNGVEISDIETLTKATENLEIGQIVQVAVRRHGDDLVFPVETIFNPVLRFKQKREIKCSESVSKNDVTVIEGSRPAMVVVSVAEYADFENPVETTQEIEQYLKAAAANDGANGVLILNSHEEVKNLFPNADDKIGFLCALLVIPKARLGVEFETGTGYENRRVVRRVLSTGENAAGLQIGDNVLAVNGIDLVLNDSESIKDSMKWNIGQEVQVTVARDGKELTFPVKTTENRQ